MRPSKTTPLISLLISSNHLVVITLGATDEAFGLLMLFLFTPDAALSERRPKAGGGPSTGPSMRVRATRGRPQTWFPFNKSAHVL